MSSTRPLRTPFRPSLPSRATAAALALLLALITIACSSDPTEPPSTENFARTWHLTSCEYVNPDNSAERVDLVADGWTVTLSVNDNGRFRYSATPPGEEEEFWDGDWTVDGELVILTRDGNSFSWEFVAEVREESMTLRDANAEWDLDDDGTPEPAIWNMAGEN